MSTIVVLEGDQTGQELLEEALRVLAPDVIGATLDFPRFDLSLENRRATENQVVYEAAAAIKRARLRAEGGHDHSGARRATSAPQPHAPRGDRRQGHRQDRPQDPGRRALRRSPLADLGRTHGGRRRLRRQGMARRRRRRRGCAAHGANRAERLPRGGGVRISAGGAHGREGIRRAQVHREPDLRRDAQGGDGRGSGAPPRRPVRAAAHRRHLRAAHLVERRTDGDSGAEPRRRHPLRPRAPALRVDRRVRVAARRLRRRLRAERAHGGGRARHRAGSRRQGRRQSDGHDPRRRGAPLARGGGEAADGGQSDPRGMPRSGRRRTSHRRPRRPCRHDASSPTRSSAARRQKLEIWAGL